MGLNKTIQDLKREVDTIKKSQSEAMLEIETLGKKAGTVEQQNTGYGRENLSCRRFLREHGHNNKGNAKCKKILTQNIQEIQDTMRRPNLKIRGHLTFQKAFSVSVSVNSHIPSFTLSSHPVLHLIFLFELSKNIFKKVK